MALNAHWNKGDTGKYYVKICNVFCDCSIDTCCCNLFNKVNSTDINPKYEINNLLELKNIL